jgi:hypothetical protein
VEIVIRALLGFFFGLFCGGSVALFGSIAVFSLFRVSQFEGSAAMGAAFVILPAGALIGGIVGATWATW